MTAPSNVAPINDDETLTAKAIKEHGEVATFKTPHGLVIFKRPTLANYERFTDKIAGDSPTSATMRELCYSCVVHPDVAGLKAIVELLPGLPLLAGKMIQRMSGMQLEGEIKKA
jgi:hypothetical protein